MTAQTRTDSLFASDADHVYNSETWSDFRLIHESEEGWSVVYSGLYHGRRVAIKGLKSEYSKSQFHHDILKKEFELTSILNHQNIVNVLWIENVPEIGESILMEYIDGITLADYSESHPSLGNKQIIDIISQICSAVAYLHSRQTVHCDLKPSNIMITSSGFVKLIDFGMSRGNGFERLDFPGGTKGFTAPENFNSDSSASVAVDIFSIGKILELLDSKGVFKSVWKKCQSLDPQKRPTSATEISELLSGLNARNDRRKRLYAAIAIVCGILILGVGIYSILPSEQPKIEIDDTSPGIQEIDSIPLNIEKQNIEIPTSQPDEAGVEDSTDPQTIAIVNIAEEFPPMEAGDIAELDESLFQKQYTEKFQQVVGMRFKQHLDLIDTMTTVRSNELQEVVHWRWLAKKDMRKWLEEKLAPNYPLIEEEMKNVERNIEFYASFSHRRGIEWSHRADAIKRCPDLAGAGTKYAYYEGMDILVVRKLEEDGEWHETRTKVPIDRSDPEATMKIKHEYMEIARKD